MTLALLAALLALALVGQRLLAHLSRVAYTPLRRILLVVWFPLHMVGHLLHELRPARWGGHPHKARLLTLDYYRLPTTLARAVWEGWFVP